MNNLIFSNNRGSLPPPPPPNDSGKNKNKNNFKKLKNNTCNSLIEVECFLNNFHKFTNYIKLYKILK